MTYIPNFKPWKSIASLGLLLCLAGVKELLDFEQQCAFRLGLFTAENGNCTCEVNA